MIQIAQYQKTVPPHQAARIFRRKPDLYFPDTVDKCTMNGNSSVVQTPPFLRRDRESSTTLSSIWDIELQAEHKGAFKEGIQSKEAKKQAPLVHFRRCFETSNPLMFI